MDHFKVKTWRILDPFAATEDDLSWLQKNCHNVQFDSGFNPVTFDYQGKQYQYAGERTPVLRFTTNNTKQETLLQLKFSDRLVLESWVNCTGVHTYVR